MVFLVIDRYSREAMKLGQGMDGLDVALLEALNGDDDRAALLRRLAGTVASGRMLDERQLTELNAVLARTPVTARLVDGGHGRYAIEMQPVSDDPERELAGQFASLLRRAPDRLKRCCECGRFFLDATRSRTRRWCGPRCGDRARVRSHRARRGP
jgi:predicted RNA-binding Zn ribbon-like protein